MVASSQKPILNKLLECDPIEIMGQSYLSIDSALVDVGRRFTWDHLAQVLSDHGAEVSRDTLRRWKREAA
jgi:hypothetical protein